MKQTRFSGAFSIVELIIVIVIIGILAGLATLGFSQWRTSVAETEVKSDLINVQTAMEDMRNFNNDYPIFPVNARFYADTPLVFATNYPTIATKDILVASKNVVLRYSSGTASTYCIAAESADRPSVRWHVRPGGAPQTGAC